MLVPFPLDLYLGAFMVSGIVTALVVPCWRRICQRTGMVDDPGHRKIHSIPTPLAGGVAVLTGFLVPMFAAASYFLWTSSTQLQPSLLEGLSNRTIQLAAIIIGAVGMVILGGADDRFELSPRLKFAGQLCIALLVAATGIRITLFVPSELFSYLITVLWILALTNALNFLDNMNGLCSGLGVVASWCCAWAAAVHGQYLVALLGFQICGALIGFIPYNFPRASVFLGDSGSHLVGFLVSVLAILPNYHTPHLSTRWAVLAPIIILAVPLFDLISVVMIRHKHKQPFWMGDTNHISHRLTRRGWSKTSAVLILWLAATLCGTAAMFLL